MCVYVHVCGVCEHSGVCVCACVSGVCVCVCVCVCVSDHIRSYLSPSLRFVLVSIPVRSWRVW